MSYPWLTAVEREFEERLRGGRLAHALLLSGPMDCGKTRLAQGFVAAALCDRQSYPACGECRSCQLLASGAHPDRYVLTFEEHPKTGDLRTVIITDQVRRLIDSLQLTTTISPRKAALIHPAESMMINAANALLKTLEEPPGDSFILLVSHNPSRLPVTIRSRCQNLHARQPERAAALEWLRDAADAAGDEAEAALNAAAGSPLRALRMIRDGTTGQYHALGQALDALRRGRKEVGEAMAATADIDPELLWLWLSLRSAEEARVCAGTAVARPFAELQQQADRNRSLVPTPVRKDLLLQDWLIQWARLRVAQG
jgi:DNA polymerase-3 subunit delta'